jgi:hypothetical protein
VNILDENIDHFQRERLTAFGIHFRQVGIEIGHSGMKDEAEIIPLLHSLRRPTFFTRDDDFYKPWLRHSRYCLVYLDASLDEAADYIRRFLRHKEFRAQAQRMGKVIRVGASGLRWWQIDIEEARSTRW